MAAGRLAGARLTRPAAVVAPWISGNTVDLDVPLGVQAQDLALDLALNARDAFCRPTSHHDALANHDLLRDPDLLGPDWQADRPTLAGPGPGRFQRRWVQPSLRGVAVCTGYLRMCSWKRTVDGLWW